MLNAKSCSYPQNWAYVTINTDLIGRYVPQDQAVALLIEFIHYILTAILSSFNIFWITLMFILFINRILSIHPGSFTMLIKSDLRITLWGGILNFFAYFSLISKTFLKTGRGWILCPFFWLFFAWKASSFILHAQNKRTKQKGSPQLALRVPCASQSVWARRKLICDARLRTGRWHPHLSPLPSRERVTRSESAANTKEPLLCWRVAQAYLDKDWAVSDSWHPCHSPFRRLRRPNLFLQICER